MRLLLDECVPRSLERDLVAVVERFEALLTVDQNIEFQQNIRASRIGVVVMVVRKNRLKELRPLVPAILEALRKIAAGDLITVGG
jgi:phosphohistidine swiveling domain-containing protein